MKVAFHFLRPHASTTGSYLLDAEHHLFLALLANRRLEVSSKWFAGDLLLHWLASDVQKIGRTTTFTPNQAKFQEVVEAWLQPPNAVWSRIIPDIRESVFGSDVFAVCAESIDVETAEYIHQVCQSCRGYLGGLEVDDSCLVHWRLYSLLSPHYRLVGRDLFIFWDGLSEDSKDDGLFHFWANAGFRRVEFESLQGRYSIFDPYHSWEHARRVAEWKRRMGDLLAFVADDVVSRLVDAAPEVGSKLHFAIKSFETADTSEEYAHVALSCRRTIEYVADQLFPPVRGRTNGHQLGKTNYRNRLLAFADRERASATSIDLICASTGMLAEQLEKLSDLQNKGVHHDIVREEARRCLIRTVLLLDDIVSLRQSQFEIKPDLTIPV